MLVSAQSNQAGHSDSGALGFGAAAMRHWPLVIGGAIIVLPTLVRLAEQVWPLEIGAHGPIVLATGVWLLFHIRAELAGCASRPSPVLAAAGFALSLLVYVFGRAFDLIFLEAGGVYGFVISTVYLLIGLRPIARNVFPFFYLLFLVPIPGWILDRVTMPLRQFVSWTSTALLSAFDYPIQREGIIISISSYRLLVEDACSGMNSLIGLIAVIMFYIYIIHRASWRYSLALFIAIVPIAIFVNILRVTALILLTYYAGDAVAQGFLHVTTGIVLFAMALGLVILLDWVLQKFVFGGPGTAEAAGVQDA